MYIFLIVFIFVVICKLERISFRYIDNLIQGRRWDEKGNVAADKAKAYKKRLSQNNDG